MAYGTIKVDTVTFTDGGIDKSVSISGLVQNPTFSGNITVTGTISGNTVQGQTVSGATVTGTTAAFTTGTFVSLTGTTAQGTTATYTTGSFTSLTGTTVTGTTATYATGSFTSLTGTTISGTTAIYTTGTFTSLTGTTTTGTTANFASGVFTTQISGATITGNAASFTTVTGGTATLTSGVFASGTAAAPSVSVGTTDNGLYSPGTDQVAISTNGTGRLFVDSSGNVGINTATPGDQLTVYGNGANIRLQTAGTSLTNSIDYYEAANRRAFLKLDSSPGELQIGTVPAWATCFYSNNTERARIDFSGRLLVGTSSWSSDRSLFVVEGNQSDGTSFGRMALARGEANPAVNVQIADLVFTDSSEHLAASIAAFSDGTWGANDYPGRLVFSTTADGASSPTERMRITQAGGVRLPDVYNETIALSANVFIDSDGTLKRATSSIKYKTDVETLQDSYADAILNCRPVWYRSTNESDNPTWGWWGFIAEEVAEIDPRLVQWKTVEQVINEDGSRDTVPLETPEPENVAYDRFVPHLLNLIKRQGEAIAELQAEVAALKAQ